MQGFLKTQKIIIVQLYDDSYMQIFIKSSITSIRVNYSQYYCMLYKGEYFVCSKNAQRSNMNSKSALITSFALSRKSKKNAYFN